ncbi:MAG: hypothetical protein R2715_22250 [Ilumatobacteraceae bacterium]
MSTNVAVAEDDSRDVTWVAMAPSLEFMMSWSAIFGSRSSNACFTSADHIAPDE